MDTVTLRLLTDALDLLREADALCESNFARHAISAAKNSITVAIGAVASSGLETNNVDDDDTDYVVSDGMPESDDDVSTEDDEYLAQFNPNLNEVPANSSFIGLTSDGDEIYIIEDGNYTWINFVTNEPIEVGLIGWREARPYDLSVD